LNPAEDRRRNVRIGTVDLHPRSVCGEILQVELLMIGVDDNTADLREGALDTPAGYPPLIGRGGYTLPVRPNQAAAIAPPSVGPLRHPV
jgi:hypothetical protein